MTAQSLTEYLSDPSTTLPEPTDTDRAVAVVTDLHSRNGSATFNLHFGDLSGQTLYAVSLFPERTAKAKGSLLRPQAVAAFLRKNSDLLGDPRNSVGCWYSEEKDATFLDVSTTLPSRQTAIGLGMRYNQIAVFDLAREEVIETEGTGEEVADLPPENERLPALTRGRER